MGGRGFLGVSGKQLHTSIASLDNANNMLLQLSDDIGNFIREHILGKINVVMAAIKKNTANATSETLRDKLCKTVLLSASERAAGVSDGNRKVGVINFFDSLGCFREIISFLYFFVN